MGSILAMAAVVSVVAGIAVVTTSKLHDLFGGGTPKDKKLASLADEWRLGLREQRASLSKLKTEELDLLGQELLYERKLLKSRNREAGSIVTIYKEPVAVFVTEDFPKAKVPMRLTLVQTPTSEYLFRQEGATWRVSIDKAPPLVLRDGELTRADSAAVAKRIRMRDGRTLHVDRGERTLAILLEKGVSKKVAPRAFEFVDVREDGDRNLLEVLTFDYLLHA